MDIAWNEYRPILRRAYFGEWEDSIAPKDSDAAKDFWAFFQKYLAVVKKKGLKADRCSANKERYNTVP